jgi:excisionase family DNA binding protein
VAVRAAGRTAINAGSLLLQRVILCAVPQFRIAEVAELLGVSDDTVRRWIDSGRLPVERGQPRRMVIDGATLAAFAQDQAHPAPDMSLVARSARNRFVRLVTNVITDTVMTQIELQCGHTLRRYMVANVPHR